MRAQIGDILIFSEKNVTDKHFENFKYGEKYIVKDRQVVFDDGDYGEHFVYFFDNHKWGCLEVYLDKYFTTLDNFRNKKIQNIIK
jgi:hypothetical protein